MIIVTGPFLEELWQICVSMTNKPTWAVNGRKPLVWARQGTRARAGARAGDISAEKGVDGQSEACRVAVIPGIVASQGENELVGISSGSALELKHGGVPEGKGLN